MPPRTIAAIGTVPTLPVAAAMRGMSIVTAAAVAEDRFRGREEPLSIYGNYIPNDTCRIISKSLNQTGINQRFRERWNKNSMVVC